MILILKILIILALALAAYFIMNKFIGMLAVLAARSGEKLNSGKKNLSGLKSQFDFKGLFSAYSEPVFAGKIRMYAAFAGFILGLIVTRDIIFSIIFAVIFFIIAVYVIKNIISSNRKKFEQQLVEALNIISTSVRTGASLPRAFENVVRQARMPISGEFAEVLKQVNLGIPAGKALADFEKRIASYDLHLAVLVMNVTREYGGNLAENLSIICDTVVERKKIRDKVDAITSQGRLSGWVITFVPFLLLAVLNFMEPAMFGLMFTTLLGKIMLCVSILMAAAGNYLIMKIVTVDV